MVYEISVTESHPGYKPSDSIWNMWKSAAIEVWLFHWDKEIKFHCTWEQACVQVNRNGIKSLWPGGAFRSIYWYMLYFPRCNAKDL